MSLFKFTTTILFFFIINLSLFGQNRKAIVHSYLKENIEKLGLKETDVLSLKITNDYYSKSTQVNHIYVQQVINDINVVNGRGNFNIVNGKVISFGNRFIVDLENKASASIPVLSPEEALEKVFIYLEIKQESIPVLLYKQDAKSFVFKSPSSLEDIPVDLVYFGVDKENVRLAWDLNIYTIGAQHWWSIKIDAISGEILEINDWVDHCNFGSHAGHDEECVVSKGERSILSSEQLPPPVIGVYNVFEIPIESPIHGERSLVVNPDNETASPYGWHDVNGSAGSEYTNTRGNNVYAYEDINDDNQPGFTPEGGATFNFDFDLDLEQEPSDNQSPAITNLFYMNNIMHDVWYHYGFDESSGNFQQNNYNNSGFSNDYVRAEAQDGSGSNNANFATPPDGSKPRMQMFLWASTSSNVFHVNSPPSSEELNVDYVNSGAAFGPPIPTIPITSNLVLVTDGGSDPYDACESITNSSAVNNSIAVIRRGTCFFVDKIQAAQDDGALAVIIINNVSGGPISMGGTSNSIAIPSIMLSQEQGQALIDALANGDVVNGTIVDDSGVNAMKDSDFDNGIIAHEYGHGISNRLTGGPSDTDCLYNEEQMGEGWSDWFGLMLTIEEGDLPEDVRGIGTFVNGQTATGGGIRPAPYSTDFSINGFTYEDTNNENGVSEPHGIGFVWATMLWDLTWAFIDEYGYDSDLYNGTGGNNMVMQLVIDGLKLQPCTPGFIDGRDAILLADQLLYDGENQCMIWSVFANRGLGVSADQGSPWSRVDQTEAFDVPIIESEQNVTICEGESFTVGANTYTLSGSYVGDVFEVDGCENVLTTHLTVLSTPLVDLEDDILVVEGNANTTYQWIDCNGFNPIDGATANEFVPQESGSYSVELVEGECSITSECVDFIMVNIIENELEGFEIFPNPTSSLVTIEFNKGISAQKIILTDVRGRIIYAADNNLNNRILLDLEQETPGVYFLQIIENNRVSTAKIVKE